MADGEPADRAARVAAYKAYLRDCIDRRPSGLRQKLAVALEKHKSFVSQITSPGYTVPIPAGDLPTILEVCHLTAEERRAFLRLYHRAHPRRDARAAVRGPGPHRIHIDLPAFADAATAVEVEALIRELAARVARLARRREGSSD